MLGSWEGTPTVGDTSPAWRGQEAAALKFMSEEGEVQAGNTASHRGLLPGSVGESSLSASVDWDEYDWWKRGETFSLLQLRVRNVHGMHPQQEYFRCRLHLLTTAPPLSVPLDGSVFLHLPQETPAGRGALESHHVWLTKYFWNEYWINLH